MSGNKSAIWLNCSVYGNCFIRSRKHRLADTFSQVSDRNRRDHDHSVTTIWFPPQEHRKTYLSETKTAKFKI